MMPRQRSKSPTSRFMPARQAHSSAGSSTDAPPITERPRSPKLDKSLSGGSSGSSHSLQVPGMAVAAAASEPICIAANAAAAAVGDNGGSGGSSSRGSPASPAASPMRPTSPLHFLKKRREKKLEKQANLASEEDDGSHPAAASSSPGSKFKELRKRSKESAMPFTLHFKRSSKCSNAQQQQQENQRLSPRRSLRIYDEKGSAF